MKRMILIAVFVVGGIAAWANNSWPTAENTFPASVYPTFTVYPQDVFPVQSWPVCSWPVSPAP